jgi:hypothetical protein
MKRNEHTATTAAVACPIATAGEVFADGAMIELVAGANPEHTQIMLWDGSTEIIGTVVEYRGQQYEPAKIEASILRQLTIPARCCPHGNTREFLMEICKLVTTLVGVDERTASLVARIVLCSAIIDAVPIAPALLITGPESARANRLVSLLRRLCWHSIPLTSVTPASFVSLANGVRYTYVISQASVSNKLQKLLDDASRRDQKIPSRGGLLDLFGIQVIQYDSVLADDSSPLRSIQISVTPSETALPAFDQDAQRRIAREFQAKLLSFRRSNLGGPDRLTIKASKFSSAFTYISRTLATATRRRRIAADVFGLLREEDTETRSVRWTDLSVIAVETVLVASAIAGRNRLCSELTNIASTLNGRGEFDDRSGAFGKRLKPWLCNQPRDGVRLRLTDAVQAARCNSLAI